MSKVAITTAITAVLVVTIHASDNGLARTPQMGWDNWNAFGCSVSSTLLLDTAAHIVSLGLKDLGYHYVILDDCWSSGRNASSNNSLVADPEKFPDGMAAVADAIHGLGLGFGIYSDAGKYTCGRFAGSLGYEDVDAQTWASWGVDYLKYDNCYNEGQAGNQLISYNRYAVMSKALNATGRPILYSLCNWGEDFPWYWARTIANSWRISGDVYDNWDTPDVRCPCDGQNAWNCGLPGSHCSIINIINKAAFVSSKSYPGAWNDLDMLEVGNGAMTDAEYVAHFSLWAAVKSPLIMGNDLRIIDAPTLSILSHAPMIAVNQDPLGSSASRRYLYYPNPPGAAEPGSQSLQMWSGNLVSTTGGEENDVIVLLINGFSNVRVMTASLADIFVDSRPNRRARQLKMRWEVRDLWANRMSDEEARWIIGNSTTGSDDLSAVRAARFNATKTSYAEGLLNKDERLLGSVVATVVPSGTITAKVGAHGCKAFRLRAIGDHDEL